jgi:hypothetical protein
MTERLVNRLAAVSGRKDASRRGFLAAATLTGTALATNPWSYLTRPADAYSSVCGPDSQCADGYTVMCCTINSGRNTCPAGSYPGGWWKADRSSYCGGGARYYIDCNASPGSHWHAHCNNTGTCDHRRVAWNIFRYGQCNTQIPGVTAVVCRQISCRPPWEIHDACGRSSATDNNTAEHNAPCLNYRNTFPVLKTFPAGPSYLDAGKALHEGQRLTSPDRHTTALFTQHGNFVIINQRGTIWSTHTFGRADGGRVVLRPTGELVVLNAAGGVAWSSHSGGPGRPHPVLQLRDSGALVIMHNGEQVWSSHTRTP